MMSLTRERIEELIFGTERFRRFTQDSPILPDVWIEYSKDPGQPVDLLLTPYRDTTSAALSHALRNRLDRERRTVHWKKFHSQRRHSWRLAYNESYVVARLSFDELIRAALPLTKWWREYVWGEEKLPKVASLEDKKIRRKLASQLEEPGKETLGRDFSDDLPWMIQLVGRIEWERQRSRSRKGGEPTPLQLVEAVQALIHGMDLQGLPDKPLLWTVSRNRSAAPAVWRSTKAVKADAATRLFQLSCEELCWAVIDSGIDATHPAFRRRDSNKKLYGKPFQSDAGDKGRIVNRTRIVATYDFTRLRTYLDPEGGLERERPAVRGPLTSEARKHIVGLRKSLLSGRAIDWDLLEPVLRISYDNYRPPEHEHGTHVAGILAGDWRTTDDDMPDDHDLVGVCPDLQLYDLRVLDDNGEGDEFTVIAALQFIRHLNAHKDQPVIHGVNISLAIPHDVANYACGRTPVCEECERLVGSGVIVVAAAGNEGYTKYLTARGATEEDYRSISITDPGNAEGVITVGATHRYKPHTYGISYFSSRGPTGDGRCKPDLVAPGEKIKAPIPDGKVKTLDGTSMATPHVSGAAALLLARHRELVGQPAHVKQILCKTATDLNRERYFQGSGMVDVLRALQSV